MFALPSAAAQDTPRSLNGRLVKVEAIADQLSKDPLLRVTVTVNGHDTDVTNDQGYFRVHLPTSIKAGQEVELTIDRNGLVIVSPLFGRQRIPGSPDEIVEVRTMPMGSKAFWTSKQIEEFITRTANDSAKQVKGPQSGETDLSAAILELARHYGFTADEVRQELAKWVEEAPQGRHRLPQARHGGFRREETSAGPAITSDAVPIRNKAKAQRSLRKARQIANFRATPTTTRSHFERALQAYQTALKALNVYHDGLGDLGLKIYPEYAIDLQNLPFKSANAKGGLGERVAGPDSRRYLEEAVREYQHMIAQVRSSDPQGWALTQNNLGAALGALGARLGGPEGQRRLSEAVEAYRQALTVRTRDNLPQGWAMTQNNLGVALEALGERLGGPEGLRRLSEAVDAYRQALTVYTRDNLPHYWATTQNNLGGALRALGLRLGGPEGQRRLNEAVEAYRQALTVRTRDDLPQQWAVTQNNLGNALSAWARGWAVRRVSVG